MPRFRSFIIVLAVLIAFTSVGYAADDQVEITGTAYGKLINLLHFDYKTATRPTGTADDSRFNAPSFYVGATKQFYIPINDPDFSAGDPNVVASISTLPDDCDDDGCKLNGFLWSDVIGWIVLDGTIINDAITDPNDGGVGDIYTSDMYPRIKDTGTVTGFAWNEVTGWIKLAANDNLGTITLPENQNNADWGVWLDIEANEVIDDNGTPAVPEDDIRIGRPFHGYAWSETMGWIKFFKEAADTFDLDFGVYTTWIPDDTPPKILSPSTVWFATGVNTGYIPTETDPGTIIWDHFMEDMESGLKSTLDGSEVSVTAIAEPGNNICAAHAPSAGNVVISTSSNTEYKVADLTIPSIGNLQDVPKGFCKYRLTAKVLNGVNLPTYIGDTFLPVCDTYLDAATCGADTDCSWTGGVCDFATPPNQRDEIIIYVRAGHFDDTESSISLTDGDNQAIADGTDFVRYEVALRDLVGNPIIPIDCSTPDDITNPQYQYAGCPGRDVTVTGNFTNELLFDLTQSPPPAPYLTPTRYSDAGVAASGISLVDSDTSFEIFKPDSSFNYQVEIASYAPSRTYTQASDYQIPLDLDFRIDSFEYLIDNDELPAIHLIEVPADSGTFIPDPASITTACKEPGPPNCTNAFNSGFDLGMMPACDLSVPPNCNDYGFAVNPLDFSPPITTSNPEVTSDSDEVLSVLSLSVPANVSFAVNNVSENSIAVGGGGLSIDHVFQYRSSTWDTALAMMETQKILPLSASEVEGPPEYLAWSSPFQTCSYCTRYEWFDGEHSALSGLSDQDAEDSVFHSFYQQFNVTFPPDTEPAKFLFDFDVPTDITADGYYNIIGRESIPFSHTYTGPPPPDEDRNDPANWDEDGLIDRSDSADLALAAGTPATPASISKEIKFTPEQFSGGIDIKDIELRLIQEIGYRFGNQPVFSVYAQSPLVSDLKVRDSGVEAVGPVIGEELVTGRKFDVISRTDNLDLQKVIRYNGVQMRSSITAPCSADGETFTFEETGDCIFHDTVNNTTFAYYSGAPGDLLTIGDGTDLPAPSIPYTLIVEGGADVLIKSNLYYDPADVRASVGIIVIAENIGQGADVYISPAVTNIVGTLYAEGSVLSGAPGAVYYGGGSGNIQNLNNQLYWRGSIASRNTIGGTGQDPVRIPDGITCEDGDTDLSCAQRYDFDYIRRFTPVVDELGGASSIVGGGLFSGGGCCGTSCGIAEGTCQYGPLPTTVVLDGNQIDEAESELAVFFVAPDPRTLSYPPPGFTVPKSFDFIQEIR